MTTSATTSAQASATRTPLPTRRMLPAWVDYQDKRQGVANLAQEVRCNSRLAAIDWQVTTQDTRIKRKHLFPARCA